MKYTLLLMGLIGLYGFFTSLQTLLRDRKRSLVSAEGTVVEVERSKDTEGFVSYTPIYEYIYLGKSYRGKHRISSSKYGKSMTVESATKYEPGSTIPLLVDEHEPAFSLVNDHSKGLPYLATVLFLLAGCDCTIAAILLF